METFIGNWIRLNDYSVVTCHASSNTSLQCIHPRIGIQNYTLEGDRLIWNPLPQTKGNYTEDGSISWTTGICWTRKGTEKFTLSIITLILYFILF